MKNVAIPRKIFNATMFIICPAELIIVYENKSQRFRIIDNLRLKFCDFPLPVKSFATPFVIQNFETPCKDFYPLLVLLVSMVEGSSNTPHNYCKSNSLIIINFCFRADHSPPRKPIVITD